MQLLLTSAAPSNIGQGGDTIIQTQNCVSPCAWVKLIFSVSRIVTFAQGPCSLRPTTRFTRVILGFGATRSIFQATRFVRVILEQGAMSSSQGKKRPDLCVSSLCKPYLCIVQKKKNISDLECHSCAGAMQQYPESHHLCAGAMQQCPEEETPSSLR